MVTLINYYISQVSRLNGSSRYVVVPNALPKLTTMVVDPQMGLLFYSGRGTIQRTALDGSNQIDLINNTKGSISGLTLDYDVSKIYFIWLMKGFYLMTIINSCVHTNN